jgi:hypothetical protein
VVSYERNGKEAVVSYERNGKETVIIKVFISILGKTQYYIYIISNSSNFFGTVIMKPDSRPDNHWWSVRLSEDWPTLVLATHYPTNNCCYQTLLVNWKA